MTTEASQYIFMLDVEAKVEVDVKLKK